MKWQVNQQQIMVNKLPHYNNHPNNMNNETENTAIYGFNIKTFID